MIAKKEKVKISGVTACEENGIEQEYASGEIYNMDLVKPALLLHSCCGPCSAPVVLDLIHSYTITIYFYNPNITDYAEYQKRLESQIKFVEEYNDQIDKVDTLSLIEGQ